MTIHSHSGQSGPADYFAYTCSAWEKKSQLSPPIKSAQAAGRKLVIVDQLKPVLVILLTLNRFNLLDALSLCDSVIVHFCIRFRYAYASFLANSELRQVSANAEV